MKDIELLSQSCNRLKFRCDECGGIVEPIEDVTKMDKVFVPNQCKVDEVNIFNTLYGFRCTQCNKYFKVDLTIEITSDEE